MTSLLRSLRSRSGLGAIVALVVLSALPGCSGSGSDVGPRLDHLPDASFKVLVLDGSSRGISGARVSIDGGTCVTGRSGRGDLVASPRGHRLVSVVADAATADPAVPATERLASIAFAADLPGPDLPFAVFLPDTGASAEATVSTGTALSAATVDDSARTGALLVLSAGTVVADGSAAAATLRLAEVAVEHLPGELPTPATGAYLFTRGFWVDPPTATFAPGASLDVPDELALQSADRAVLLHLDHGTGEWSQVSPTLVADSGGRLQLGNGVVAGGLYVYAFEQSATATVRGRVVDTHGSALSDVMVRVGSARSVTAGDGRFALAVAGALADGTARAAAIDLRGGGAWLPAGVTTTTAPLGGGADVDVGDLELDTVPATTLRLQVIERGRAEAMRRVSFSSVDGLTAGAVFTDDNGQCTIEELASGFFGSLDGHLFDRGRLFLARGFGFIPAGRRWDETRAFFGDRPWVIGSRSTRAEATDAVGGGPVRDAVIVRGRVPGSGFSGRTQESGIVFVGREFDGRATATVRTERAGVAITSAFTIENPNGDQLDLPLDRVLRDRGGAFDRHGVFAGSLTGFDPAKQQRVRASRPLEFDEWFDEVMLDVAATSAMPVRQPPALPGQYRAGVALPRGHVAVAEGTRAGPVFTLTGIGVLLDQVVPEGTVQQRDLPIDRPADTNFVAPALLDGLDAAFTVADLSFDLALQQPSGRVVDVARGIGGNMTPNGSDVAFLLPALSGELTGHAWLLALKARVQVGTTATEQRVQLRLDSGAAVATPHLPVPTINAPADGASVAAAGFTVDYALPAGTLYATIELESLGTETLRWTAVVPPAPPQFAFVTLPTEAATPLVAGRTYELTVTAYRADAGDVLLQQDPYRELTTLWQVIGAGDRGVRATASRTITVTAN
jgi:hypothetical protein